MVGLHNIGSYFERMSKRKETSEEVSSPTASSRVVKEDVCTWTEAMNEAFPF